MSDVTNQDEQAETCDTGYTLIELLIVVLILGIIGSVVVLSLSGLSTEAADTGCDADQRNLFVAAEAFFAQTGAEQILATGVDHDRFERTLADGGFLRSPSAMHDVDADGKVTPQDRSSC